MRSPTWSKNRKVIYFDGGHSRIGRIWAAEAICDGCGQKRTCVSIDASQDEYDDGRICADCVALLTASPSAEPPPSRPDGGYSLHEAIRIAVDRSEP